MTKTPQEYKDQFLDMELTLGAVTSRLARLRQGVASEVYSLLQDLETVHVRLLDLQDDLANDGVVKGRDEENDEEKSDG